MNPARIILTASQKRQLLRVFRYIEGLDPEGSSAYLQTYMEAEDHALDKLYERML